MHATAHTKDPASSEAAQVPRGTHGLVVSLTDGAADDDARHETVTRRAIAARLAALKQCEYGGEYDHGTRYDGALYFVPGQTLVGNESSHALGIRCEDDVFGGVVPFPFMATKTITHPLVGPHAHAPEGWSSEFASTVCNAVLPGFSAFSPVDAREAGERLLQLGAVRVKPALAIGGRGQSVVGDQAELDAAIAQIDRDELARCGVVLEHNLTDVATYSVGRVSVAGLTATYFGTQALTIDNSGQEVYGGSALTVANGDFDALLALQLGEIARLAIERARVYDTAARECFPGFFASRRNYDVAAGRDCREEPHCAVLEQSWRIGGASSAEIAALEAFARDPSLRAVRAECIEAYGECSRPPEDAVIYFSGIDSVVGQITKYAVLAPYVDA